MNAKDKQEELIKTYLKPKLKEEGFRTSGQTWWKLKDQFFIVINLQNSQFNTKESSNFCFNIGVGLTENLKDPEKKKATYYDIVTNVRENAYLSNHREKHKYREGSTLGYLITNKTDLNDFIQELSMDFEQDILPKLNGLQTIDDCLEFYQKFDVWGERLQNQVLELNEKNYKPTGLKKILKRILP